MTDYTEHNLREQAKAAAGLMDILRAKDMDDDQELVADTIEGETDFLEAIDQGLAEIDACAIIATGCKSVMVDINARRRRAEDRAAHVKSAIEQALIIADVSEKIVRPTATLSLTKYEPKRCVEDESKVPSQFFVPQPPKLDLKLLGKIEPTEPIAGCYMNNGSVGLSIRRK